MIILAVQTRVQPISNKSQVIPTYHCRAAMIINKSDMEKDYAAN